MRLVLLHGCETWIMSVENVRRLEVFDRRCPRSMARVGWGGRVSNVEIWDLVLSVLSTFYLSV